jgi:hypothetical protein
MRASVSPLGPEASREYSQDGEAGVSFSGPRGSIGRCNAFSEGGPRWRSDRILLLVFDSWRRCMRVEVSNPPSGAEAGSARSRTSRMQRTVNVPRMAAAVRTVRGEVACARGPASPKGTAAMEPSMLTEATLETRCSGRRPRVGRGRGECQAAEESGAEGVGRVLAHHKRAAAHAAGGVSEGDRAPRGGAPELLLCDQRAQDQERAHSDQVQRSDIHDRRPQPAAAADLLDAEQGRPPEGLPRSGRGWQSWQERQKDSTGGEAAASRAKAQPGPTATSATATARPSTP